MSSHPLPGHTITVAAAQADPVPGDLTGNAVLAARLVRRAAGEGAALVILPELFLPAYHPPALRADPATTDVAADSGRRVADARLDPIRSAAGDSAVVVCIGAAVRHEDGRRTCATLLVQRDGSVTAAYDKQNLCGPDEKSLFVPGERGATVTVDGWRFGLGICYDGCFPEHARAAAADGAHGYLVPAGYFGASAHRRDVYYAARALDNTFYVALSNSVGGAQPWRFNGGAAVYDPQGRAVAKAADTGEAIITATLDPAVLGEVRAAHSMLADRPMGPDAPRLALNAS